jgi:hypothetical protein
MTCAKIVCDGSATYLLFEYVFKSFAMNDVIENELRKYTEIVKIILKEETP